MELLQQDLKSLVNQTALIEIQMVTDPIWLDEEGHVPQIRAEEDHEATGEDEMLLFIRADRLKIRRAPNVPGANEGNIKRYKFWVVDSLPADSYVSYNLTKAPLGLRSNDVQPDPNAKVKIIAEICKPLGKVPTVVRLILAQSETLK